MPDYYITTFTGVKFYLDDPRPEMIVLEDLAHHLSHVCRWAGACRSFYSVAQHSVIVSGALTLTGSSREAERWGLLHDAAEAYIGDITRPLKQMLGMEVKRLEERIMLAVARRFDLEWPCPDAIYDAVSAMDNQLQTLETRLFMPQFTRLHDRNCEELTLTSTIEAALSDRMEPLNPRQAEVAFLRRFAELRA